VEIRPLAQFFHQKGFSVAGPLLPGHGTSPEDLNARNWKEWLAAADESYQLLKSTSQRVIVGGESLGGLLSLYLGSLHPEIAGLLLYAPALRSDKLRQTRLARFFKAIVPKNYPVKPKEPLPWQGYTVHPVKAAYQLYSLQHIVEPRLKLVNQPTLIVQGEKDRTIDPRGAQIIYDSISSSRKELVWMKNSGHCVVIDQEYEQVMAISLSFVQSILSR
ncbi:alpha/beta fold hydrolase, partial [bacterium]